MAYREQFGFFAVTIDFGRHTALQFSDITPILLSDGGLVSEVQA